MILVTRGLGSPRAALCTLGIGAVIFTRPVAEPGLVAAADGPAPIGQAEGREPTSYVAQLDAAGLAVAAGTSPTSTAPGLLATLDAAGTVRVATCHEGGPSVTHSEAP